MDHLFEANAEAFWKTIGFSMGSSCLQALVWTRSETRCVVLSSKFQSFGTSEKLVRVGKDIGNMSIYMGLSAYGGPCLEQVEIVLFLHRVHESWAWTLLGDGLQIPDHRATPLAALGANSFRPSLYCHFIFLPIFSWLCKVTDIFSRHAPLHVLSRHTSHV